MGLLDSAEAYIADKAAENEFASEINKVTGGTNGSELLTEAKGLAAGSSAGGGVDGFAEQAEDFAGSAQGKSLEEEVLKEFS